jgi:hypothetical protein
VNELTLLLALGGGVGQALDFNAEENDQDVYQTEFNFV